MTGRTLVAAWACLMVLLGPATSRLLVRAAAEVPVTAFVDVNVVPMDGERVQSGQTVIVRDGRIAQIGPSATIQVPQGALRIGGQGRYLVPGLADMHAHLESPEDPGTDDDFLLFVANGVTTVRNPWGTERTLSWRARIAKGNLLGPTIYTTGPIIDGNPPVHPGSTVVETPQDAERVVAEQQRAGFDFLKVYARLRPEVYDALAAAARQHDIRMIGHVPAAVGLERALAARQASIEHLSGYVELLQAPQSPFRGKPESRTAADLEKFNYVDETRIAEVARATREAGVWNCVTIAVHNGGAIAAHDPDWRKRPEMKYVPASRMDRWNRTLTARPPTAAQAELLRRRVAVHKRLTKALRDAGAGILLGTDTRNPLVVQGFSVHDELQHLVDAGLSPYEAIKAGTRDAAVFLNASDEFGTVTIGKRADLVLVDGNPLARVGNLRRRSGVMVHGRWLPANELQQRIDAVAASRKSEP